MSSSFVNTVAPFLKSTWSGAPRGFKITSAPFTSARYWVYPPSSPRFSH